MDEKDLESMNCVNCGRPFRFVKGTIKDPSKFTCTNCATSTLEDNVETHKNAGKKLLVEG